MACRGVALAKTGDEVEKFSVPTQEHWNEMGKLELGTRRESWGFDMRIFILFQIDRDSYCGNRNPSHR